MKILITGGAGYIGSHTTVELLERQHEVVIVDNLSNGSADTIDRITKITDKPVNFIELDVRDKPALSDIFKQHNFDAVIHFAGLKAVGESHNEPLRYYDNNLMATITVAEVMSDYGVRKLIFSSSATVYGNPVAVPIEETATLSTTNPYGRTKLFGEQILGDLAATDTAWDITMLRYFNPIGAHPSGLIGESPKGTPTNLLPFVAQVAAGLRDKVQVFGNDYPTPDGTGVRDYIHVQDLALAHVAALDHHNPSTGQPAIYNLGTGRGYSVLEIIHAFEKASGRQIPYEIVARRPGDIAAYYANPAKAQRELHWAATKDLDTMCADAWRWQCSLNKDNML